MNAVERYDYGIPIFNKLFELDRQSLFNVLDEICGDRIPDKEYILKEGTVKKITSNDKPEKIEIYHYGSISITPFGIYYKPEHGSGKELVEFNKFFTLDNFIK